jgi:hypothetical protein
MRLATLTLGATSLHMCLFGYSILTAQGGKSELDQSQPIDAPEVVEMVTQMYTGFGVDHRFLTDDIVFEDPVAKCSGLVEVSECFRSLKAINPIPLSQPQAYKGKNGTTVITLHQKYFNFVRVESSLVLTMAEDGKICSIVERWNHAPLADLLAVRFARRVNGVLSYAITSRFV